MIEVELSGEVLGKNGLEPNAHQLARTNVVMAALAVLGKMATSGEVCADTPFVPDLDSESVTLLEAATAVQTEVSLSIDSSDPLISDVVRNFRHKMEGYKSTQAQLDAVDELDQKVQALIALLQDRGPLLVALSEILLQKGEMSVAEIGEWLKG